MPRYFLHIVDHGQLIEDEEGVELESAQDAFDEAEIALRELLGSAIAFNQPLVLDALVVADPERPGVAFHAYH
jgi:hypothetical protein